MSLDADGIGRAAALLRAAQRVFVLTGAGMGVGSGLKTFRGDGGYWREKSFAELASRAGFEHDPVLVWTWYNERFAAYAAAEPNAGHRALAELERVVPHVFHATQNVDGLQKRAGSRALVELHGDLQTVRCTGCAYREVLDARSISRGSRTLAAASCGRTSCGSGNRYRKARGKARRANRSPPTSSSLPERRWWSIRRVVGSRRR